MYISKLEEVLDVCDKRAWICRRLLRWTSSIRQTHWIARNTDREAWSLPWDRRGRVVVGSNEINSCVGNYCYGYCVQVHMYVKSVNIIGNKLLPQLLQAMMHWILCHSGSKEICKQFSSIKIRVIKTVVNVLNKDGGSCSLYRRKEPREMH